jgi:hypothetical protein
MRVEDAERRKYLRRRFADMQMHLERRKRHFKFYCFRSKTLTFLSITDAFMRNYYSYFEASRIQHDVLLRYCKVIPDIRIYSDRGFTPRPTPSPIHITLLPTHSAQVTQSYSKLAI